MSLVIDEKTLDIPTHEAMDGIKKHWGMDSVYGLLSQELSSSCPLPQGVREHVLLTQGKGIRPMLVLISAGFGRDRKEKAGPMAAALEMLHMATLAHDDVIDGSSLRRSRTSINAKWGDGTAVLLGDFFYGKSLKLVSPYGVPVTDRFADIILDMVTGEFQEAESLFDPQGKISDYLKRTGKKTASFFSHCCGIGAMISGISAEQVKHLEQFGYYLGVAFQIKDDILDWCSSEEDRGKPVCHDLKQGVLTLPILFALRLSKKRGKLGKIIKNRNITLDNLEFIKQELIKTGAIEYSYGMASLYGDCARIDLNRLPGGMAKDHLETVLEYILDPSGVTTADNSLKVQDLPL